MITWYQDKLYPLQDEVCASIAEAKGSLELYLTGGTCLSRCYLVHRYSDDLDFFYHDADAQQVITHITNQLKDQFLVQVVSSDPNNQGFLSLKVADILKVDFVKDVGRHFGQLGTHQLYSPIDTIDNILANKISALMGRDEAKDLVDIISIAENQTIDWPRIFTAVNSKAAGIMPPLVAKRLQEFPLSWLDRINWVSSPPTHEEYTVLIDKLITEVLKVPE